MAKVKVLALAGLLLALAPLGVRAEDGKEEKKESKPIVKKDDSKKEEKKEERKGEKGGNVFTRFWTDTVGGSLKTGAHKIDKTFD